MIFHALNIDMQCIVVATDVGVLINQILRNRQGF